VKPMKKTMMMTQMSELWKYVRGLGEISWRSESLKTRCCALASRVIATVVQMTGDQLDQILPPWISHYNDVQQHMQWRRSRTQKHISNFELSKVCRKNLLLWKKSHASREHYLKFLVLVFFSTPGRVST